MSYGNIQNFFSGALILSVRGFYEKTGIENTMFCMY